MIKADSGQSRYLAQAGRKTVIRIHRYIERSKRSDMVLNLLLLIVVPIIEIPLVKWFDFTPVLPKTQPTGCSSDRLPFVIR
jgi:hypothetical protein